MAGEIHRHGPERLKRLAGIVAVLGIAVLLVVFWLEHLRLGLDKEYAIDEFQYAHGAWLIAQGEVIYRDFFEHHFPLIHQVMALVFLAVGDEDPGNLIFLRLAMLPFLTLLLLAAWRVNAAHSGRGFALLAPLFVLMVPSFSMMAVEVRPDSLAFALFLSALAILFVERLDRRVRGFLSGVFFVAAVWGTLKVAYYGLVFPAALAADLARRKTYLLGHPWSFLAGCVTAALPIAGYLTWTSSWGPWYEWCISWSFVHQFHYPGFLWTRNFTQLLAVSFWLFPLAIAGLYDTLRRRPGAGSPEWLLVGAAVTSLASFAWQSAAYLYSLVPFTVILCIFAGRGLVAALRYLGTRNAAAGGGIFFAILLVLMVAVEVQRSRTALAKLGTSTNAKQHALLSRVHQLTRPDEPVLHIAGGQVTRPSVHFFYFFEAVVRKLKHDVFAYELPRAMTEKGAVAYMPGPRFRRLPEPLQRFLLESFQPYDQELWFWGRHYRVPAAAAGAGGELAAELTASRAGRYFVWPLAAPRQGEFMIDAQAVTAPVFELAQGRHNLIYRGTAPEIFLVWLPADGQPFEPRPELKPR